MAHLNCFPLRAAGVNFCFFIAVPSGGCWYKAKCEMRDAATHNRRQNECAKLRIFREIAKWRRLRHDSWLTATAVVTDPRRRFSTSWHVADVKNIVGYDHATLIVDRNSGIYVCLRLQDRNWRGWRRLPKVARSARSWRTGSQPTLRRRLRSWLAGSGDRSNGK